MSRNASGELILRAQKLYDRITELEDETIYTCVEELEKLHRGNNKSLELSYIYAQALLNLVFKEVDSAATLTIAKLEQLHRRYAQDEEILICLGAALAELAEKQDEAAAEQTRARLESLCQDYPDNDELWAIYADTLDEMELDIDLALSEDGSIEENLDAMEAHSQQRPDDSFASETYARRLCEQAYYQNDVELQASLDKLSALVETHPRNEHIAAAYTETLMMKAVSQYGQDLIASIAQVEILQQRFPHSRSLAIEFGKGFALQSIREDLEQTRSAAQQLKNLWQQYGGDESLRELYLMSLINRMIKEPIETVSGAIEAFAQLYLADPGDDEVTAAYIKALCLLSIKQTQDAAFSTLNHMRELLSWHELQANPLETRDERLADAEGAYYFFEQLLYFGLSLASLCQRLADEERRPLLQDLSQIAGLDAESEALAIVFADTLRYLNDQSTAQAPLEQLQHQLAHAHPNHECASLVYDRTLYPEVPSRIDWLEYFSESLQQLQQSYPNCTALKPNYQAPTHIHHHHET